MNIKRLSSIFIALIISAGINTAQADTQCDNQSIFDFGVFGFPESGATGSGNMCATPVGLKAQMNVDGLIPGNAYTVWWVYFDNRVDNETVCGGGFPFTGSCGFGDFGGDNPVAVFGRLGSAVAQANGKAHFGDELSGMQASSGSEVWLLMFGHGSAALGDGRQLARQLLTPEDPTAGFPHLGVNANGYPVAMTVHAMD